MNRTIEYIAVTLVALAFTVIVAVGASRYLAAQFERSTSTFEVVQ
jgi:hypothetical protein